MVTVPNSHYFGKIVILKGRYSERLCFTIPSFDIVIFGNKDLRYKNRSEHDTMDY